MPLISIGNELRKAQSGRYAVPCFDTFEMMGTQGMLAALEEKRSPAIVALYAGAVDRPGASAFSALLRALAEEATVPISLMLDHGASYEQCIKALRLGFSDVMYDGSKLPLEENIATTCLVARAAHAVGACAEAELGHVGVGVEYDVFGGQRKGFTDPAVVERFVAETGVDFLAVAIGTAHGVYKGEPQIDLDLLDEIRRRVEIPLVLHGGSGLSTEQFQAAVAHGIAKINIFTDLGITAGNRMIAAAKAEKASYFSIAEAARQAFHERVGYYLDTFGSSGRA
jgi:fructose-bisphosphate aldolase class II